MTLESTKNREAFFNVIDIIIFRKLMKTEIASI